jgi:hypothetical protein
MPKLGDHQSKTSTKMLFIGDSGAGKTGALASLAAVDYRLHIADLDNGLDVLKNLLTDNSSQYFKQNPKCAENVDYVTITDKMKNVNGRLVPGTATAWTRTIKLLMDWTDGDLKLGPITTWGPKDILVIDSLTMLSTAALNMILSMNGRLGQRPHQSDWGDGQQLVEGLLQMLYDEGVQCNVIVCCHITFLGEEGGPLRGYPNTLGKALPPKVGRYFNSALMARTVGQGTMQKRKILTNTSGIIELKNTAPMRVLPEYPLETGLAQYFAAVRG